MSSPALLDINRCRRRPDGNRLLIYLDQSSLSGMVRYDRFSEARDSLLDGVRAGRMICPRSLEHDDESRLAQPATWQELDRLSHQLSPEVRFRTAGEIENREIRAAARALLGYQQEEIWREAFTADPHTAREKTIRIFGGEVTVRATLPPEEDDRDDIVHEKAKEAALTEAYRTTREQFSFEEICEANLHVLLEWKLGPLASTSKFVAALEETARAAATELERGEDPLRTGSAFRRFLPVKARADFVMSLCEELPELKDHAAEFFGSQELRTMPSLLLYAYLRAGLAVIPGRTGKRGDGYDINHLVHGMSRCDIVTADRGMVEMITARRLLPVGVQILESSDVSGLIAAVTTGVDRL